MSTDFSPTRVPGGGPRSRLALGIIGLVVAAVVGVGLLGGRVQPGKPETTATATATTVAVASATPEPTLRRTYLGPTPRPDPDCSDRSIGPVAGPIPRHPRELAPTGLETVARWGPQGGSVAVDLEGRVWTAGAGRLERLDPTTGSTSVWTFTDDPGFDASGIKAAKDGGVWLYGGRQVRWFDGQRFADVIDVPNDVYDLAAAPDGSLWAGTDLGTLHWDGSTWSSVCDSSTGSYRVENGADGAVWMVRNDTGTIARYDDVNGLWTMPVPDSSIGRGINAITAAPDGSLWALDQDGLYRFGRSWEVIDRHEVDLSNSYLMAAPADGSVWVGPATVTGATDAGTGVGVARRLPSGQWQTYGAADGLVARDGSAPLVYNLTAAGDTVYASTADGMFQWAGSRWARIGLGPVPGPEPWSQRLIFDRAGDLWVATDQLWQYHAGSWIKAGIGDVRDISRNVRGTLLVTTGLGLMVRSDGEWSTIDQDSVFAAAIGVDDRVWAVVGDPGSGQSLWSHDRTRGRWRTASVPLPKGVTQVTAIVADEDGTLWLRGGTDTDESFWRLVGRRWDRLPQLGVPAPPSWGRLALTPGGDLLTVMSDSERMGLVGRLHGSRWTTLGGVRPEGFEDGHDLALDSRGTVWMPTNGLAALRGASMTLRFPGHWFGGVTIAPDRSVWVAGPSGIYRIDPDSPP